MKKVKKWLQYFFTAFGVNMAMLFFYFATFHPQTIDKFVTLVTATLSAICSLWICGYIKRSDNNADDE